ncbi:MAG: CsbD family protein [Hyphomicrobium sp.]
MLPRICDPLKRRIKGAALRLKGNIKTTIGRLTGNERLEAAGAVDKAAGSARTAVGAAKDAIRSSSKPR